MRFCYLIIAMMLVSSVALANGNATNQTNETQDGEMDYVGEAQGILEGMYSNWKSIIGSVSKGVGIELEGICALLVLAVTGLLLGKRARKYLFYILILFFVLWIVGFI